MSAEQIKERVKLRTEFLKFYFIALIAVSTGVITILAKDDTPLSIPLIIIGLTGFLVLLVLIVLTNRSILRLVGKLN